MALTFFRWLALAVAGTLIATVAIMREPRTEPWSRTPGSMTDEQRDRARDQFVAGAARLRLLEIRDSVSRAVPAVRAGGARLVVAPAAAGDRVVFEGVFAATMAGMPAPALPLDVVVIHDSGAAIGAGMTNSGRSQSTYFLPDSATGERCLVVLRYQPPPASKSQQQIWSRRLGNQLRNRRLLGPCAFYAAFGKPGPEVRRWLDRHRWAIGYSAAWMRAPERWRQDGGPTSLHLLFNPEWDAHLRAVMSPEGFRCAAGDRAECTRLIVDGLPPRAKLYRPGTAWGSVIDPTTYDVRFGWYSRYGEFGPRGETILAEMVRTLGPDRFRTFWQSAEDPATAFQSAAGQDLGSWMLEWSLRVYGAVDRGPAVQAAVFPWVLVAVAAALALAMRASNSRSVR